MIQEIAVTSLAKTAEHLASKGRHGDTMLVHMNPIEVAWMDSQTPGGLTINPETGQPEAFTFLLPLLANFAAPSIMGALGLSGMGATLGTAALTGLADYAVNKDPSRALGSGLLSFGLGGLSNAFKGPADTIKNVANAPAAASTATPKIATSVSDATKAAMASQPTYGGLPVPSAVATPSIARAVVQQPSGILGKLGVAGQIMQDPKAAFNIAKANPLTIGLPIATGAALTAGSMMQPSYNPRSSKEEDKYKSPEYTRERFPAPRTITPYGGDYASYGVANPEHSFFNPNNVRGMAQGGGVFGPGDGVSDSIPTIGPGGRPIHLSDGEYVIPADVVSMLGYGSTNGGNRYLDKMIADVRANPPRKEKGAPPKRQAA